MGRCSSTTGFKQRERVLNADALATNAVSDKIESPSGCTSHPPDTKKGNARQAGEKQIIGNQAQEKEATSGNTRTHRPVITKDQESLGAKIDEDPIARNGNACQSSANESRSPGAERVYPNREEESEEENTMMSELTTSTPHGPLFEVEAALVVPPPQAQIVNDVETPGESSEAESVARESTVATKWKSGTLFIVLSSFVIVAVVLVALIIENNKQDKQANNAIQQMENNDGFLYPVDIEQETTAAQSEWLYLSLPPTASPTKAEPILPTLQRIHNRGHVICRGDPDELKQGFGFSIDMVCSRCRVKIVKFNCKLICLSCCALFCAFAVSLPIE